MLYKKKGFFCQFKHKLLKTRKYLELSLLKLFRGKIIDNDFFEKLEEQLLSADIGIKVTKKIINKLTNYAYINNTKNVEIMYKKLKYELLKILIKVEKSINLKNKNPFIILIVGVNGTGKTTTIGKLSKKYIDQGNSVMLVAGDTFRAAATDQLQIWGDINNISVIKKNNTDPASVIFDAIKIAKKQNINILLVDTSGRLHNKIHLMDELKKIIRVIKKLDSEAPHEIMLILDANTGQNALQQTKLFNNAVKLTGISITKLDGTAKGGIIFSIAENFNIPIRYIGVGEKINDLRSFKAKDFIEAIFIKNN